MATSHAARHVRLFKNGRNQAVRIPREFELPGDEAILRRESTGRLIIEPLRTKTLLQVLNSWDDLEAKDTFPKIEDRAPDAVDL